MAFYFAIGRRGMGKTTLAYKMTLKISRRLIFDPRGMIRANPDAIVVVDIEDMRGAVREVQAGTIEELVFTPSGDLDTAFEAFAEELRRWIVTTPGLAVAVLIDEASFIDQKSKHFQWVVRCSPVDTFHTLMTCHRPLDIDTTVRAIADHWLIFQCRQEHDLKVIRERCSFEVADEVQRLGPRHYVHWNDARATLAVNRNGGTGTPSDWYVPLRCTIAPAGEPVSLAEPAERLPHAMGKVPLLAQPPRDEAE